MMRHFVLSLFLLGLLQGPALADKPAPPRAYVVSSPSGMHYFKMLPDAQNQWNTSMARGMMFKVGGEGQDTLLWETKGWYAYQVFVPEGGEYLVRMGNWSSGCGASNEDLALSFIKQGRVLKSYSTADLFTNPKAVDCTVSHYFWLKHLKGLTTPYGQEFELTTLEDKTYTFSIKTGGILP